MMLLSWSSLFSVVVFFFNDTATTEIYTLSLHDALPIWSGQANGTPTSRCPRPSTASGDGSRGRRCLARSRSRGRDRKSTRLNSSHANISYAVFCLKKKKKHTKINYT